jgi:hypothetical protein
MAPEAGGSGGNPGPGPKAGKELPQHPLVENLKPDPSQPARKSVVLTGLPGKSDRQGYQRLYLTTKLDYYAEFLTRDILNADVIPADRSPFPGLEATRVTIGRDSTIHYILVRSSQPVDEFDLDIRLGAQGAMSAALPLPTQTCPGGGCDTRLTLCDTCPRTQCDTCHQQTCVFTRCNQHTCGGQTCINTQCNQATCGGQTCVNTQCNQQTCVNTQCNQATCGGQTCVNTQCNQHTCGGQTCVNTQCNQHTCGGQTCVFTQCNQHTCGVNTCDDTCFRTCVTCIHPHCPLPQ